MTSYGEPQPYGRARVPGGDQDEYAYDAYDSYADGSGDSYADGYGDSYAADSYAADSYAAPVAAGTVARAGAGRASPGQAGVGRASVGSASVGSASVAPPDSEASPTPRYAWGGGGRNGASSGRASVPVSPGGAVSGRASVRPTSPGGPGGPGGPPRAAGGPAGRGPGGRPPGRKKKRHWIRNTLLSIIATFVILTGGGMVALSYYVDSVPPPEDVELAQSSTILYSNGESEMAVLQEVNREIIDTTVDELANVRNAVIAAEDTNFHEHSGVDFVGIMRAAWNNFTGGDRQGASTIDQQYTRRAAGLTDDSYGRKLREAAMAYKLNQEHSKEEILGFYLNTVYFGRGAHGVEAAAEAYFGKSAVELTVAEAAVLAGVIRVPDDGSGYSPYDPFNPDGTEASFRRWNYVLDNMVVTGAITAEERGAMEYPEVIERQGEKDNPFKGAQGTIVKQVEYELADLGFENLYTDGYRITTTIDPEIQKAVRHSVRKKNNDSAFWDAPADNVEAALVAIDPQTGGVLGYYGGEDGQGFDLAGPSLNEKTGEWEGGRPPGSSFKIYTLMAALEEGVSFDTHWKTTEFNPGYGPDIRNAGRTADVCEGQAPDFCTLRWATQQSYNVPFMHYAINSQPANSGPAKIVDAAKAAGITVMLDNNLNRYDLTEIESGAEVTRDPFDYQVAIGQYGITVLDHANGVATLAASGMYHEAHFVKSVEQKDPATGEWVQIYGEKIAGEQRIRKPIADAITGVLTGVRSARDLSRPAAGKTGTWEHKDGGSADAWMVGYTPQLAAAVWVGNRDGEQIKLKNGTDINSGGLPTAIWQKFMTEAHERKEWAPEQFPPAPDIGNDQHPYANGERKEPDPPERDDRNCGPFGFVCDDDDDDRGDRDDNRGPGNGDDGDEADLEPGDGGGQGGGGLLPSPEPGLLPTLLRPRG